jgi:acetyl esterase/lipase
MGRLTLLFTLLTGSLLQAAAPPAARKHKLERTTYRESFDVRYAPGGGVRHTLDLFLPDPAGKQRPVVLFVHGGTWMIGDKDFYGIYRNVGRCLAKHGIVTVMINYRLSPMVKHPEHAKDVASAYAWCYKNVARYGGDPDCIFLAGHSAGAHLASLIIADKTYLKDPKLGLDDKARKAIRGVIGLSGVYRVPPPDEFQTIAKRMVEVLVGAPDSGRIAATLTPVMMGVSKVVNPFSLVFGKDREVQDKASPIRHVHADLPPFLLFNAEREVPGLWPMAHDFVAALKKQNVPVNHYEIEGATHRTIIKCLHRSNDDATKLVLAFIARLAG